MIARKLLEIPDMELHERLESLRERRGLSVPEIARRLKRGKSSLYGWFNGESCPRLDEAIRLAEILETTVAEMAGETQMRDSLTEEERDVLKLYHALGLSRDETWRRMSGEPPLESPGDGRVRTRRQN